MDGQLYCPWTKAFVELKPNWGGLKEVLMWDTYYLLTWRLSVVTLWRCLITGKLGGSS